MEAFVQKQYDSYQENFVEKDVLEKDELRQKIIDDLSYVSQMGVEEYTLYQKWLEIQMKYLTQETSTLFGLEQQLVNPEHEK